MDSELQDRMLELEVKTAYQERTIEELHEVVLDLRKEIEGLRREFEAMRAEAQASEKPIGPANEAPPHY
jgi:SlyX protein